MSDRSLQSGYYNTITYLAELLDEVLVQLKLARGGAPSSEIEKVAKMLEAAASEERRDLSTAFLRLILRDGLGEQQQTWQELSVRLGKGECDEHDVETIERIAEVVDTERASAFRKMRGYVLGVRAERQARSESVLLPDGAASG